MGGKPADTSTVTRAVAAGLAYVTEDREALGLVLEEPIKTFGTFEVKQREARIGRNPKTMEEIRIPARRVPVFRPGKELRDSVT